MIDTPFSTASLYLDIISSLYGSAVKAGLLPSATVFSRIKVDLKTLGQEGWKRGINDEIFNRALRLTRNVSNLVSDDAIAGCLVQWSLTHGLTPLTDIALLKREDLPGADNPQSSIGTPQDKASLDAQLLSLASAKRRYILPLRQSQRTPRQLSLHINKIVNDLFRRARLPIADNPFDTIESLWA
ncbi:MAG: hypothetical protein K2O47_01465, partial [Muribaculaceae bacterium]|nr:hypothetical protein [Muribaculaceae bacterium]